MKRSRLLAVFFGFAAALFIQAASSPGWAQTNSYTKINPKGQKAYSAPISDRTVKFELTLPSGKVAKLITREGEMAKFGDLDRGYAFALVPVIKDPGKRFVSFTIFRLTQDKRGNESVYRLWAVDAKADAPTSTKTEPRFKIRVLSIEEAKPDPTPGQ